MTLQIKNLHTQAEDKKILNGVSLTIPRGEVHVVMGPNGSGKSTLANTLMGDPRYEVTEGSVTINGEDILSLSPDKRAKLGLFLSMQHAPEISGVSVSSLLRVAVEAKTGEKQHPVKFYKTLQQTMQELGIDPAFANRSVNAGFSGGEKKRLDILQLTILDPTYAILDETDSGLDVDALKAVGEGINAFASDEKGLLIITHYNRLLQYVQPDVVHIMVDGAIVKTGTAALAKDIEDNGFEAYI